MIAFVGRAYSSDSASSRIDRIRMQRLLQVKAWAGEVLREDFMKPLGLTVNRLATRIGEIVQRRLYAWQDISKRTQNSG